MAAESNAAVALEKAEVVEITIKSFGGMSAVGPNGEHLALSPSEIRMGVPCCYADVVARIEEYLISNGIPEVLDQMMLICEGRLVGHAIPLSESIVENKQFSLMLCLGASSNATHQAIGPPYNARRHNTSWPPAVNFYGDEPINLGKIGQYKDGECICCDEDEQNNKLKHDNTPGSLVILDYGGGLAGRVAYNRWTLFDYLAPDGVEPELRDPLLRRRILDKAGLRKDLILVILGMSPPVAGDYIPVISVRTE
jgi:hypothetical protein